MKFYLIGKGKFFVIFITFAVLLAIGAGVWYSISQNEVERTSTKPSPAKPPAEPAETPQETSYVLAFSGGYNRSRIPFSIEDFDENGEIARTVKSYQELLDFCAENNFPFFDETDENYHTDLAQKVRAYDADFFKTDSLLLLFKLSEAYDLARFEGLQVDSGVLTVSIDAPEGTAVSSLTAFVYLIETPKTVAEQVTAIQTETTRKGERIDYCGTIFYELDLEDLVAAGELDMTDVNDIAYYYDGELTYGNAKVELSEDYSPRSPLSEPPSEETKILIYLSYLNDQRVSLGTNVYMMEDAVKQLFNQTVDEFYLDIASIDGYYGTYNDHIALKLSYDFSKLREIAHPSLQSFLVDYSLLVLWKPAE